MSTVNKEAVGAGRVVTTLSIHRLALSFSIVSRRERPNKWIQESLFRAPRLRLCGRNEVKRRGDCIISSKRREETTTRHHVCSEEMVSRLLSGTGIHNDPWPFSKYSRNVWSEILMKSETVREVTWERIQRGLLVFPERGSVLRHLQNILLSLILGTE